MFLEKQQKKSAAMRDIIERLTSWDNRKTSSLNSYSPQKEACSKSASLNRSTNSQVKMAERPQTTTGRAKGVEAKNGTTPQIVIGSLSVSQTNKIFPTEPPSVHKGKMQKVPVDTNKGGKRSDKLPSIHLQSSSMMKLAPKPMDEDKQLSIQTPIITPRNLAPSPPKTKSRVRWIRESPQTPVRKKTPDGPLADVRYKELEDSLSVYYIPEMGNVDDITPIISGMDCLSSKQRFHKDRKAQMSRKIRNFIAEQGYAF